MWDWSRNSHRESKGASHWLLWFPNQRANRGRVLILDWYRPLRLQHLIITAKCKKYKSQQVTGREKQTFKVNNIQKQTNSHRKTMQEAGSIFHKEKIFLKDLHSNNNNNNKICTSTSCTTVWNSKDGRQQQKPKTNNKFETRKTLISKNTDGKTTWS